VLTVRLARWSGCSHLLDRRLLRPDRIDGRSGALPPLPCPGCDRVQLASAGQLLLGKADGAVESLGPCLGCDYAREHRSPSGLRRDCWLWPASSWPVVACTAADRSHTGPSNNISHGNRAAGDLRQDHWRIFAHQWDIFLQ
jgi:hypothetical protein